MLPNTLPIRPASAADSAAPVTDHQATTGASLEPLLVDTEQAARAVGISSASWYRLRSGGKTPAPVKLGGRVLYRLADLRSWVAMGCPPRKEFETRRAADQARAARAV